jgi:hydroxymethylbilane synthase
VSRPLRIGSRGSKLALWQAELIQRELRNIGAAQVEIVIIKTAGDRFQKSPVGDLGLKGVFIKELEDALLSREVDLAVHSLKDVPTEIPDGLAFPAICRRADVRDCLVSRSGSKLHELSAGARLGTSSLRRQSQLRHLRPDLQVLELRGNVDTRLRKVERGDYDAVVLAKAGLDRLGWSSHITEVFEPGQMLPAVGQGALGIECRSDDREVMELLALLDHAETRAEATAERALLARLQGGCQVPLGALGQVRDSVLRLEACVLSPDGKEYIRDWVEGSPARAGELGEALADKLLSRGADRILKMVGRKLDG